MSTNRTGLRYARATVLRVALIVSTLVLILFGAVGGAATPSMPSIVISSGEAMAEQSTYRLHATFGQPLAGSVQTGGQLLCVGFQCSGQARYSLFLPTVHR